MKHYVIINEWGQNGINICGVTHSFEEAKEFFNNIAAEEKEYAKDRNFTIYADEETSFDAGKDGYYATDHTVVFIEEVEEVKFKI